jgi:predicted SAM-dependent methyltransferase
MTNVSNELYFLILNIRAYIGFKVKSFISFVLKGHVFRNKNFLNYQKKNQVMKLHLGSTYNIEGFFNSQIIGENPINITNRLPFKNDLFEIIFSTHVIEHLHRKEIIFFLQESFRVLKPGGKNIILTPSLDKIINTLYVQNNIDLKNKLLERQKKWAKDNELNGCSYVNGLFRNYGHRFIVNFEFLKSETEKIGYSKINVVKNDEIPDIEVNNYIKKYKNDEGWNLETESYILEK